MDLPPPLHHLRDGRRHTEGHRGSEQGCEVQGLGVNAQDTSIEGPAVIGAEDDPMRGSSVESCT